MKIFIYKAGLHDSEYQKLIEEVKKKMKFIVELSGSETIKSIEKGTLLSLIESVESVEQTELSTRSTGDDAAEHEQAKKPAGTETSPAKPKPPEKEQPAEDPKPAEEKKPAPAPAPANKAGITIEKLQEEAVQLLDGGTGTDRLSTLLTKYGVKALPDLKPDYFAAFLTDLQKLKEATE